MATGEEAADLARLIEVLRADGAPECGGALDALVSARETIEQLETAVERRTVIGQATGVLMAQWGLESDGAWDVLRQLSQDFNIKVYDLAEQILALGVPDTAASGEAQTA